MWNTCKLKQLIGNESELLNGLTRRPGNGITVPHVFVKDGAFPLRSDFGTEDIFIQTIKNAKVSR